MDVADGHENIAGTNSDGLRRQLAFHFQVELVHLHVPGGAAPAMRDSLRNGEDNEKQDGKRYARNGGFFFREQVYNRDAEQDERNKAEPQRNLHAKEPEIQRHTIFAVAGMRVTEDQDGHALHGETPNNPESVQVRKEGDVAAADNDREDLQTGDDVDDAIGSAKPAVRLTEPVGENAIFRDAVQYAVRTHNGRVHGAGQNQRAYDDDEAVEEQPKQKRSFQIHGQSAN